MVLGIVKASLEVLGIGIGVKKVFLLMSGTRTPSLLGFEMNWNIDIGIDKGVN